MSSSKNERSEADAELARKLNEIYRKDNRFQLDEDAFHDILLRILEGRVQRHQDLLHKNVSYLISTIRNRAIDIHRSEQARHKREIDALAPGGHIEHPLGDEHEIECSEQLSILFNALERMKDRFELIQVANVLAGEMSMTELAQELNISTKQARTLVSRGLRLFRAILNG